VLSFANYAVGLVHCQPWNYRRHCRSRTNYHQRRLTNTAFSNDRYVASPWRAVDIDLLMVHGRPLWRRCLASRCTDAPSSSNAPATVRVTVSSCARASRAICRVETPRTYAPATVVISLVHICVSYKTLLRDTAFSLQFRQLVPMLCQNGVVSDSVGPHPQYDVFADKFLDHASNNLFNAHYDRPACLALLGAVAGRTVLDAACGPGLYAEALAARGANVIGFDQSPRMAKLAEERVPSGRFRTHDLADPLDWLTDESVDLVLFALALEYVDDRTRALRELRRVLRPDGALVLSRQHPTGDWLRHGGNYFDARVIEETWSQGWRVRYWLAPLEQTCEELHEAGFLIERLLEPRPTLAAADIDRDNYERLNREPRGFLAVRAMPDPRRV
jgi:SAM-dependent methyltransferase